MQPLSELIERELPLKPDPDLLKEWYHSEVTQWHIASLKILHQKKLEAMSVFTFNSEADLASINFDRGVTSMLEQIVDGIEELADV